METGLRKDNVTLKFAEWSKKVKTGDWVAFKKNTDGEVFAIGQSYESVVQQVKDFGKEAEVNYSQVPPMRCSLLL